VGRPSGSRPCFSWIRWGGEISGSQTRLDRSPHSP